MKNSEFTVTANNLEELRRYARKYKKQQVKTNNRLNTINLEHLSTASNPATSVSGSQDSDDDDLEDVSSETETPSIEKSLGFGLTSASTESLDFFGQRENYFKNNFESLNADSIESRKDNSGNWKIQFNFFFLFNKRVHSYDVCVGLSTRTVVCRTPVVAYLSVIIIKSDNFPLPPPNECDGKFFFFKEKSLAIDITSGWEK